MDDTDLWWTTAEAAGYTGYTAECIRKWVHSGRVRSRRVAVGRREFIEVAVSDVRQQPSRRELPARSEGAVAGSEQLTDLRDRVATLEEIVRRHHLIDEMNTEIQERQLAIARHYQEIEIVVQGPSTVQDLPS